MFVCYSRCVCVCTLAGLAVVSRGEAHLTLAAVSSRSVQTLAVLTQVHVIRALIHVCRSTDRKSLFTSQNNAVIHVCFHRIIYQIKLQSSLGFEQPDVPEQLNPSPLNPSLQEQRYEPGVFMHSALGLQLCSSVMHSSTSAETESDSDCVRRGT